VVLARLSKAEARQPASSLFRRRDFEGRGRELEGLGPVTPPRSSAAPVASPRSSSKSTRTHTRTLAIPRLSFQPRPSLYLSRCTACTNYPFFFILSPFAQHAQDRIVTLAPSEQSRLLPGIATSTSNATQHGRACVCQRRPRPPTFPSPPLVSAEPACA